MSRKVIIAVAPVKHPGSEMPAGCRNPQSAAEVAAEVVDCARAGASMVHLHVRDESGVQAAEMDVFARTLDLIRAESDIIIQGSTGGASWGVTHDGMKDLQILAGALGLGASAIRVGFEDSFYYAPGKTATTNVELVTRARALVEAMGLEPMMAEEARRALEINSKGLDS